MPQAPYIVSGKVYTKRGTVADSVVTIGGIRTTTNSSGEYVVDLANMSDDYSIGTSYTYTAQDEHDTEYKTGSIILSGEGYSLNIFLDQRDENTDQVRNSETRQAEIRTAGNKPVSKDNLLPVENYERPMTQKLAYVSGTSNTEYVGRSAPGTPTSEAKWRIEKYTYDGNKITDIKWAKGNAEFDKVWNDRATYDYS